MVIRECTVWERRFAQGRIKSWSSCTSQCTCFWILLCDSYPLLQANALPLLPRQVVINISYHPLNAVTKTNSNQTTNWTTPPQWMSSQSCGRIWERRLWPHEEWNRGEPILVPCWTNCSSRKPYLKSYFLHFLFFLVRLTLLNPLWQVPLSHLIPRVLS